MPRKSVAIGAPAVSIRKGAGAEQRPPNQGNRIPKASCVSHLGSSQRRSRQREERRQAPVLQKTGRGRRTSTQRLHTSAIRRIPRTTHPFLIGFPAFARSSQAPPIEDIESRLKRRQRSQETRCRLYQMLDSRHSRSYMALLRTSLK